MQIIFIDFSAASFMHGFPISDTHAAILQFPCGLSHDDLREQEKNENTSNFSEVFSCDCTVQLKEDRVWMRVEA